MNVIQTVQGTSSWLALRATCDTASEAPAARGVGKYTSRTDLLKQKSTGFIEEVSPVKQRVFDSGHAAEAAARPLAEAIIGEELYPVTATLDVGSLKLLASMDGATMDESIIWEHKLYSAALAADVKAGTLDPHYTVQMDQQLMVSGATKCLFMTSDGTKDNMAWCWYEASEAKFTALIDGWTQFRKDLAEYVPQAATAAPIAAPQMSLPAVSIRVNGSIALIDNLDAFGAALTAYVARINKTPTTDQDFADLEATVKTLKTAEEALESAETNALAQTESIDTMRRTVGLYRDTARTNRLLVEKLVKVEKETRRAKIISDAVTGFAEHMDKLNTRLGKNYMPTITADFQGVVKGLKSIDSMNDKVATELARVKIEANATADRIQANLEALKELASDHKFLFADTSTIVMKANDDLTALIKSRIADHVAAEAAKEEATRARIQAEEEAKAEARAAAAQAEAMAQAAADKAREDVIARAQVEAQKPALAIVELSPVAIKEVATNVPVCKIVQVDQTDPTLRLGQIADRLGFVLKADFLKQLGFEPAGQDRAAVLFHEADFVAICTAVIDHVKEVQAQFETETA